MTRSGSADGPPAPADGLSTTHTGFRVPRPRRGMAGALLPLAVSAIANAASSYALQLVTLAVATGTAALNPLRHLNRPELALAVAASYAAWLGGLALNAHANWKLLERDGVSVSATSKLLHDAALRASGNLPLRYGATLFGFVIWEAIEEVPWVLGALGIQALAAGNHGWSFLAGSNAGAAAYNLVQSMVISRIRARPGRQADTPPATTRA
jgi:hypothetical protein